jgi:ribose transport system substrate-binding protein
VSGSRRTVRGRVSASWGTVALVGLVSLAVGCGGDDGGGGSGGGGGGGGTDAGGISVGKVGTLEQMGEPGSISELCGDKKITVALADGFGGNIWRQSAHAELVDEAKRCPNITDVLYANAEGNLQKALGDIRAFAAQGVDVLVLFPDHGPALVPSIRQAYKAGTQIIPYYGTPLLDVAKPGRDLTDVVAPTPHRDGKLWAEWLVKVLDGKGEIVYLGGTPGNPVSEEAFADAQKVIAKHPGMKFIENRWIPTDWDPAKQQRLTASLLAKYPNLAGIMSDFSDGSVGSIRAFLAANRPLVPIASGDSNGLGCAYQKLKDSNPNFELATRPSGEFLARVALRKGVAAAQGIATDEPSYIDFPLIEDSTDPSKEPKCDRSLPAGAILSARLTREQQQELFATE